MVDNTVRDEGPINPIEEAKSLGANLATPEKAKIARERKIQTNPAGKNCNKTTFKRKQVKKKATIQQLFGIFKNKMETFGHFYRQLFGNLSANCG